MPVETEIKLRVTESADQIRARLARLGYVEFSPRQLEADQVFDLPDQALRFSGRLLRVRRRGPECTLTYKGPVLPGRHKSREEIETEIADGEAFETILDALGYQRAFRYEKYRSMFISSDESLGVITLDETPIGNFLELEGPEYWIDDTAAKLGFSQGHYITRSYFTLYQEHRKANPGAPENMVF